MSYKTDKNLLIKLIEHRIKRLLEQVDQLNLLHDQLKYPEKYN